MKNARKCTVLIALLLSLMNPLFLTHADNIPSMEELQNQLWNNYVSYHNGRIKDMQTMNQILTNDSSIQKMASDYITGMQNRIGTVYQAKSSTDPIGAYFDARNVANNAYIEIDKKISTMNIPPIGYLDTMNPDSLKRYVLLYVDKQELEKMMLGYFPIFNMLINPMWSPQYRINGGF